MKNRFRSYEFLFPITGILFFTGGLLFNHRALDVNLHNTYFVIGPEVVAAGLLLLYIFVFLLYRLFRLFKRPLHRGMGILHYILTTGSLAAVIILYQFITEYRDPDYRWVNTALSIVVPVLFLSYFLLLVNMGYTLLRRKKTGHGT